MVNSGLLRDRGRWFLFSFLKGMLFVALSLTFLRWIFHRHEQAYSSSLCAFHGLEGYESGLTLVYFSMVYSKISSQDIASECRFSSASILSNHLCRKAFLCGSERRVFSLQSLALVDATLLDGLSLRAPAEKWSSYFSALQWRKWQIKCPSIYRNAVLPTNPRGHQISHFQGGWFLQWILSSSMLNVPNDGHIQKHGLCSSAPMSENHCDMNCASSW